MFSYKVVTLGSSGAGKSSIVLRYVTGNFSDTSISTVGASYLVKQMSLSNGKRVRLELWDTAGQERYASLAPLYYRGAQVALIVYDVTDRSSWERAQVWVKTLQEGERSDIIKVLVGNKIDLEARAVEKNEAETYAAEQKIMHIEASAKTGAGVAPIFTSISNILAASHSTHPVNTEADAKVNQKDGQPALTGIADQDTINLYLARTRSSCKC